jgi:hypothetical protein
MEYIWNELKETKENINNRDEWQTPNDLFNHLNIQYNFFIDCCANNINTKCNKYFNKFENIDFIHDNITCWMNPPFSKSQLMFNHFFKIVSKGVAIYRCDNLETKVWQNIIIPNCSWILIPNKRIIYTGLSNKWNRPVFASSLIGLNVPPPKLIKGRILKYGKY